jgi:hypothetical protein
MVLPQAISKATGLGEALAILRLSPHNAVAIGDAENDHELLHSCEVGVAVAWGSEALKTSADHVLPGDGPPAVAGYIRALLKNRLIPEPLKTRRHLVLGHTDDGSPLALAIRGRNLLVAGDPKTGKSWVAGLLCEQLILYGYSLCIVDPEGDYTSLEALPGVVVFGVRIRCRGLENSCTPCAMRMLASWSIYRILPIKSSSSTRKQSFRRSRL